MSNGSNRPQSKPQQIRKPAPKDKLPTPEEVEKAINDADMDTLDRALYNDQGKVAPVDVRASPGFVEDAPDLNIVKRRMETEVDLIKADLVVSSPGNDLKDLAKSIPDPVVEAAMQENHRSGPSYLELKAMYEAEKTKAEEAGEMLNMVRTVINNPFHRYGQFVDSIPLGRALKMEKVWQPKASS
jgi:hypothetical protein